MEQRRGDGHYAVAASAIPHGAPCDVDGFVGVAVKQIEAPAGTGLGATGLGLAVSSTIQPGEAFFIRTKGLVLVAGAFAAGDALYIDPSDFSLRTTTGRNEKQTVTVDATAGTFKLTYSGQQTAAIAFDASAVTLQAALVALSNIAPGDVLVTLSGSVYTVEFAGALAATDVTALTADATSLTGGTHSVTIATTVIGRAAGGTTTDKFGRVEAAAGSRGVPTGKVRVNLDARKTF